MATRTDRGGGGAAERSPGAVRLYDTTLKLSVPATIVASVQRGIHPADREGVPNARLLELSRSLARTEVRIANRKFRRDRDGSVAALFTGASLRSAQLADRVVEEQRTDLIRTLAASRNLVVDVECSRTARVRVRDGQRLVSA
jgi:hypothetical protein